jgi:hypothetical protein
MVESTALLATFVFTVERSQECPVTDELVYDKYVRFRRLTHPLITANIPPQSSCKGYRVPKANTIYDPEFIAVLKLAFEEACGTLPPGHDTQSTRALIAERILKAAATGERDPVRLRAQALLSIDNVA